MQKLESVVAVQVLPGHATFLRRDNQVLVGSSKMCQQA